MFVFAGVFVALALTSQCAHAQPTYDVSGLEDRIFYWKGAGEMLEEIARSLWHVVLHQERQEERMERLEQMLNESTEGQHRLEMQVSQLQQQANDVENHNARYADAQQSILALYDQKRQNESAEQLEMIAASIRPILEGQSQIIDVIEQTKVKSEVVRVLVDFAANASQKFAEIGDDLKAVHEFSSRNAENCRVHMESIMQVGNASLDKLRYVAHHIHSQQLQQQARDATLLGNVIEMTNNASRSLAMTFEQIQSNIGENVNQLLTNISQSQDRQRTAFEKVEQQVNASVSVIQQGQGRLVQFITSDLYQEVQLLKVAAFESRELIGNNISVQLKDVGESCIRAVDDGFGDVVRAQTQLQNKQFGMYQEAVVSNMSKIVEVAHSEVVERLENMTREAVTVTLTNITTHLREMQTMQLSEECFTNGEIVGIVNNLTNSQQQLFVEVEEQMERKMNESLVLIKNSHAEIQGLITDKSDEIQSQLTRVDEVAQRRNESDLLYNRVSNLATVMLTEMEDSCASVASSINSIINSINSGNAMLAQRMQSTTSNVLANTQLLRTINQASTRSAGQLRQQHNRAFSNITTELSTIWNMLSMFIIICHCQGSYVFACYSVC